ncbi:LuxR C-terminal-related transcriptional regulator [Raoultibacter massiliensis]|uniref:LuxR C-terminal-related transcriptional regulator n=1 Tax=Raoultibacter massiliensis TaxID=1852371 RepID=UPI003A92A24A
MNITAPSTRTRQSVTTLVFGACVWATIFDIATFDDKTPRLISMPGVADSWLLAILASLVTFSVYALASTRQSSPIENHSGLYALAGLTLAGGLLLKAAYVGTVSDTLILSSSVLIGVGTASANIILGSLFACMGLQRAVVFAGLQLGFGVGIHSVMSYSSNSMLNTTILVSLLIGTLFFLAAKKPERTPPSTSVTSSFYAPTFNSRLFALIMAFAGFTYGVALAALQATTSSSQIAFFNMEVLGSLVAAGALVISAFFKKTRNWSEHYYQIMIVLISISVASIPMASLGVAITPALYYAGFAYCYSSVYFLAAAFGAAGTPSSAVRVFALLLLCMQSGQLTSGLLMGAINLSASSIMSVFVATVLLGAVIIVVTVSSRQLSVTRRILGQEDRSSIDNQCDLLAMRCNLTQREREVLMLLLLDKTNQEIADALVVSNDTIKTHVKHIYRKTEAHSRSDLKACAKRSLLESLSQ